MVGVRLRSCCRVPGELGVERAALLGMRPLHG